MKRFLAALTLLLGLGLAPYAHAENVCTDTGANVNSVAVNVGSATTAQILAAQGTQPIHVCSFTATIAGTTPTVLFIYGTGTNCATNNGSLTGTFAPTSGTLMSVGYGGDLMVVPAGNELCVTTGGTTPSLQGILTYVAP